jgi:hypothetical protein
MMKKPGPAIVLIDLLLALGAALYAQICLQSGRFTVLSHSLRLNAGFFALWLAAFLLFLLASGLFRRGEAGPLSAGAESGRRRTVPALLPLGFFLLSPWLLHFYFSRDDLRVRLRLLALFIITAIFLLELPRISRYLRSRGAGLDRAVAKFSSLPLRRRLIFLFLGSFLIYQAAALSLVFHGASFTGDEPFYLLSSHSLLKEGDINVADNYARQDYFYFYSKKDNPKLKLGVYGRYGRRGKDTIYPINLPGISVLMLPFYWLSQFFSGRWLTFILKASLSPWAVLLGLQLYLYAREVWGKERLALGLWAFYSFSSPLLFYAVHLYPEVPVALFCFSIFRKVTGPPPLSILQLVVLGLLLGLLPWFGLKFNFFFWPLLLISVYFLIARHRVRLRAGFFIAPAVVSMALFYVFIHSLYGTFSPIAVYEGVLTPERTEAFKQTLLAIPLRARVDSFLDYFLDQRDGLLLYSPAYFFAFLGLVEIWRRRKRDFWCFLLIGLPFLANYALFTHRQGASPQGRVLMPLTWMGAIAVGHFLIHNRRRIFSFLFGAAVAAGTAGAGLLLAHPSFLYQPTTHEFTSRPGELFVHLSNLHFFLPPLLPSFIKVDNSRYWPNYIWLLGLAAFILAYALSRRERPLGRALPAVSIYSALAAAFFLWILFPRSVLFPVKTVKYSPQRALGFYTFPMGKGVIAKDSGDFYLHLERDYKFVFGSRAKLDKVKLVFGSAKGEYDIRLSLFDLPLFDGQTAYETREFIFAPAAAYRFRSLFLYEVKVRLIHRSVESMLLDPYLFQVIPARE